MPHETAFTPPATGAGAEAGPSSGPGAPSAVDQGRLFQAIPTPAWVVDQESLAIRAVNQAATRALGYAAEELVGSSLAQFVAPDERNVLSNLPGVLQARSAWSLLSRDGRRLRLEVARSVVAIDGRPCALLFHPPETEASAQEVARSGSATPDFSFSALHDLKEPLHLVKGYLLLLRDQDTATWTPQAREYLDNAFAGTQRLQATVTALLEYFRTDAKGLSPEPVDLGQAVDEVLAGLRLQVSQAKAIVTRDALPTVWADRLHLARVLENLLSNAVKFRGSAPPHVHIGARQAGGAWDIWVQDDGIGLAAKDIPRVLQPFQRVHSTDQYPGTGLGLSICKKVVEMHGGRLWIESAPGRGTAVHFTLPLQGGA